MKTAGAYHALLEPLETQIDGYNGNLDGKEFQDMLNRWSYISFESRDAERWLSSHESDIATVKALPDGAHEWRDYSHANEMFKHGLLCVRLEQWCHTNAYYLAQIRAKRGAEWCDTIEPE